MRWFLPERFADRPAHLPPIESTGAVSVIAGPDGKPGRMLNGIYTAGEPGWVQVGKRGWWINPIGSSPRHLLRLDARDGTEIDGPDGQRWLIPHLFRPAAGGLLWFGEQRLGPTGWAVPPPPEPWHHLGLKLRKPIIGGVEVWERLGEDAVTDLALLLICSNYHLLPSELIAAKWLTRKMIPAAFAACIATPEG